MEFKNFVKDVYCNKITKRNTVFFLELYLTNKCRLNCKHCFKSDLSESLNRDMTFDEVKIVVSQARELSISLGIPVRFVLIGGDPLLHPDFYNIAKFIGTSGFMYTIKGNPLNKHASKQLAKLKSSGLDRYQISIDGLDNFHDWIRGEGEFKKAIKSILYLRKQRIASIIRVTLFHENQHEILELIPYLIKLKVSLIGVSRACGVGNFRKHDLSMISPENYKIFLSKCLNLMREYFNKSITTFDFRDHLWFPFLCQENYLSIDDYDYSSSEKKMLCACSMFNNALCVMPGGQVFACSKIESSLIGDFNRSTLLSIQKEKLNSQLCDVSKYVKCHLCQFYSFCMGCPAVSNGVSTVYSADPQCWLEVNK